MKHIVYERKVLGNQRFLWKQKEFVLSTFNCIGEDMDKAISNCKEAGFNLLEVGWGRSDKVWEAVEKCEQYGMDLIFQDISLFGGMMDAHDDRPVKDETIVETANKLKSKKHTIGFYVWDEPHLDYLFKEARRQSDILLECVPDALLFSVFPPSYNSGPTWDNGQYYAAFEEYLKVVEPPVLSMDHYPIGDYCELYPGLVYTDEKELDDSPMWLDLAVARNLARKYQLPFWFYYQGCGIFNTEKITFPMVRSMMYAGALYGAKGLQNYTAAGTYYLPSDGKPYPTKETVLLATGEKGEFFEEQKAIHEEFRNLGNTLMALENRAVYHSSELMPFGKYGEIYKEYADDMEKSCILTGELPARTSVGELYDAHGNDYLFILNRDFYKALDAELHFKGRFHVYEVSKTDGKQSLINESVSGFRIKLEKGDAILLRLQDASEEPCTVAYCLR